MPSPKPRENSMTTEYVSVPRKVYENLAQIADGKMSYNDMQDLAAEAYNILSRATPSGETKCCDYPNCPNLSFHCDTPSAVYPNADTQAYIDELHVRIANLEKVVASRVVTSNDVNDASLAYNESIEQTHDGFDLPWCDEDAMRAALESFATSLPAAGVPDAIPTDENDISVEAYFADGWNACRQVMLDAASQVTE